MKKLLFFLLSVVLIGSVGCGSNKDLSMEVTDAGSTEVVNETSEPTTEAVTVETEDTENVVPENTEAVKEMETSDDKKETDKDNQSDNKASDDKSAENKQTDDNESSDNHKPAEQPTDTKNEPVSEQQPKTEPQSVSYSPDRVVSLAISKCQAGGMVTTEQHLKDNLNTGKITQEEYDEYYPLDGLEDSYYSVFVNVDLNKAATTSGRALGSEEAIAKYIADMLLLESDNVFNIRYTGTTKTSGETFYEFRCYR